MSRSHEPFACQKLRGVSAAQGHKDVREQRVRQHAGQQLQRAIPEHRQRGCTLLTRPLQPTMPAACHGRAADYMHSAITCISVTFGTCSDIASMSRRPPLGALPQQHPSADVCSPADCDQVKLGNNATCNYVFDNGERVPRSRWSPAFTKQMCTALLHCCHSAAV